MSMLSLGRRGLFYALALSITSVALPARAQDQDQAPPPETPAPATYDQTVPVQPTPEAAAPEKKDKSTTELTTVEVTGSRLKRADYETAAPVVVISRDDIDRTGLTSISDILSRLTAPGNDSLDTQ